MQKLLIVLVLIVSALSPFNLCLAADLHLYLVIQTENKGDSDQVRAVADEVKKLYSQGTVKAKEFDLHQTHLDQIKSQLKTDLSEADHQSDLYLLLTVSTYGIDTIHSLSDLEHLKKVHLAHQVAEKYFDLIDRADVCVLPGHAVTEELSKSIVHSKTHLIQTVGVLHSLKRSDLIEEYSKNKTEIPVSTSYLGVILAGDAPTPDGKMQYFSVAEAENLASYISKEAKKTHSTVLVLNGPRTGKYDPKTGQANAQAHRDGKPDPVTLAFHKRLQTLLSPSQQALYDFQFGKTSYYKAVLGAILSTSGKLFVPGESTSMISESVENLPGLVYVYENGAMNPVHSAHVKSELQAGRLHLLSTDFKEISAQSKKRVSVGPQAWVVAQEILKILK